MERVDIDLYDDIREALSDYGMDYILDHNDLEPEDVLFHLIRLWGLELPR